MRLGKFFASVLILALMLSVLPVQFSASAAAPSELFFSEYIEGSSYNKAVEIYNGTGGTVDLSTYTVELYSNGAAAPSADITLSGTLANGDVFVLAHGSADAAILAVADLTSNSVINFNGDDALVLRNNGTVVDAFGQVGFDPGSQWTGGGLDDTLRRAEAICSGDTNPDDAFDASLEWVVFPVDTFDGLGSHTANCSSSSAIDVFMSEYIEGSSYNKAIEIYNGTANAIELSAGNYTLELYSNGATIASSTMALSGTIASGDVFVLAHGSADPAILAEADVTNSSVINFNGDDAVVLRKDGVVVDAFGQIGVDPGTQWPGGGLDDTLRRAEAICAGDTNPDDAFDASTEWITYAINTFDGLGSHTADCGNKPEAGQSLPLIEGFDDCTLAGWEIVSVDADTAHTWSCSSYYSNIEANGYSDTAPANEWLITPALNMDAQANDKLTFRSYTRYTDINYPQLHVLYSNNYDGGGDPTSATWTELSGIIFSPENSGSWTDSGEIDLSGISGTNVYFAFQYVSSGTGSGTAATWRLDAINFFAPAPLVMAKIHEVQGSGDSVAITGGVIVDAIVVADYQGDDQLRGFFLQEEDADVDIDSSTSEGIFVYCGSCSTDVAVGDLVEVIGQTEEYYGMSQIDTTGGSVSVLGSGNSLPTPATIDLPASGSTKAEATFENVEGMLVTFTDTLYVSEYFELARYDQLVLTADARPQQFTDAYEPSVAGYTAFLDDLNSKRIILDDDNNTQNNSIAGASDKPYFWPRPGLSNTNYIRGGDSISGLTGVLHWSYAGQSGTNAWRVRPVEEAYSYAFTANNERTTAPDEVYGTVKVASFNVLNYFTTINSRGADSIAELDRQREKTADAICAIDADVVGLIEIENNGAVAISDLLDGTNGINANCGPYAFIDTGVIGTDEITVAFIYKTATAAPFGNFAILDSSVDTRFIDTKNRPALAQTFADTSTGGVFTVVVNHLKSKGSDCNDLSDPDVLNGQGNCNLTRTDAAAAMVDWLATDPTGSGDPDFLIIGDLNSYRNEDPIDTIKAGADDTAGTSDDYTDLLDTVLGSSAYSYVFDGQLGYLDHALAGSDLVDEVSGVTVWHINADEIPVFDYNDEIQDGSNEESYERESAAQLIYEASAYRSSDHDPVIIGLELTTQAEIYELIDDVQMLVDDGVLNGGQGNGLISKLENVLAKLARGNTHAAANQLGAFINQLEDFVSEGILTTEQAEPLIKSAMLLIEVLSN